MHLKLQWNWTKSERERWSDSSSNRDQTLHISHDLTEYWVAPHRPIPSPPQKKPVKSVIYMCWCYWLKHSISHTTIRLLFAVQRLQAECNTLTCAVGALRSDCVAVKERIAPSKTIEMLIVHWENLSFSLWVKWKASTSVWECYCKSGLCFNSLIKHMNSIFPEDSPALSCWATPLCSLPSFRKGMWSQEGWGRVSVLP